MHLPNCDPAPLTSGTRSSTAATSRTRSCAALCKSTAATSRTRSCAALCKSWVFRWVFRWECLKPEDPLPNEDPFKHSNEYRDTMDSIKHNWDPETKNRWCKIVDEMLPLLAMGCVLGYKTTVVVWDFIDLTCLVEPTSMGLVMFANDVIEWAIVMGACLMWHTFCYWNVTVHWFWKLKVWPLPSLMPGGFMPRLAAFSLGLLMFTTNTLVSEGRVEGKALLNQFGSQGWDLCRATDMQADHASTMWFARILRRPPSVREDGSSFTCFNVHTHGLLWWSADELKGTLVERCLKATPQPFNKSRLQAYFDDQNSIAATLDHDVEMPYNGSAPLSHSFGFPMNEIVPVIEYVDGDLTDANFSQYGFHCMYQCTKFKSVGLMSVIEKVGTIVAGSAVVVKTSDTISTNFGGHIWGLPLVNKGTDVATIRTIIQATLTAPGRGRSKLWAWGVCCFAMMPLRFASKLNVDGYFTVDYYVTAVFFSSLIMACVVRQYHPFKMIRIAYTEKMWTDGKDSFLDKKSHSFKEIDMYEWIHLSQLARARHLKDYARRINTKEIKEELNRQKNGRESDAGKKQEGNQQKGNQQEGKQNPEPWCRCIKWPFSAKQTKEHGTDVKKMETEYYNKHAKLIVKVVQEITESTVSPPLWGEKLGMAKGTAVCKKVVVRPNAVGTIIDQVNDNLVKIRFPKKVENPPVWKNSLPKVSILEHPNAEEKGSLPQASEEQSSPKEEGDEKPKNEPMEPKNKPKKKLVCFKSGAPVAIIDKTGTGKFEDDEVFGDLDEKLRKDFRKGTAVTERQYHMTLTPNFEDDAKHKVNAWLHNAVLRMVKPRPRHMLEEEDDDHETKREDQATKWEDVSVPLDALLEASPDWADFEAKLDELTAKAMVVKDKKEAEVALPV